MKFPRISLALLLVGLFVVGAACQPKDTNENVNDDGNGVSVVNENRNANTNSDDDENENENSNSNENENVNDSDAVSGTLRVSEPDPNKEIESPFEVAGDSSSSAVTVHVKRANGTTLFSVPVTVRNGQFSVKLEFQFTNTTAGLIEVVEAGGSTVRIPVTFKVETEDDSDDDSDDNSNADDFEEDEDVNENSNTNSDD